MNTEKIAEIYSQPEFEGYFGGEKNKIFKGLQILSKYTDEISINPAHDEIYAGLSEDEYAKMTEDDVKQMFKLDWRWDDESFVIFT